MSQPQSDPRPRRWWLAIGPPKCYLALHRGGVDVNRGLSRDAHMPMVKSTRIESIGQCPGVGQDLLIGSSENQFHRLHSRSHPHRRLEALLPVFPVLSHEL